MATMVANHTLESFRAMLRKFQLSPPVDVVALAEALDLSVWEIELPDDISGKIIKDSRHGGTSGYSILVNSKHAKTRKRFTVGHEIGHFILHRDKIGDGLTDDALYRSGLSTLAEVQANKMAADILMPFTLIEREMNAGITNIADLAEKFVVSKEAMSIRLQLPA